MTTVIALTDKIVANEKAIEKKKLEIDKRREVVDTVSNTYVSKKKDEARIEAIDIKISSKVQTIEKTIDYYKLEISKAEKKQSDDISIITKKVADEIETIRRKAEIEIEKLQNKAQVEKQKIEDKFTNYRDYCLAAIQTSEEKRDMITAPFEKKKEMIQNSLDKSEDDDKILVRLKVELKQLVEEQKELNKQFEESMQKETKKQQADREAYIQQEAERMRLLEIQEMEKARAEREARESQERFLKEERWARQKEERAKESEREVMMAARKSERKVAVQRFNQFIYPSLSEEAAAIYTFFKNSLDKDVCESAKEKETVEECEAYLNQFQETVKTLQTFYDTKYKRFSEEEQEAWDALSPWDQIREIKQDTKKKSLPSKVKPCTSVIRLDSIPVYKR